MSGDRRPIGIFDSGVGGLTVLVELRKRLPGESFIYFGDTGRVPYGIKGKETVTRYSIEIVNHLVVSHDVKALVVACNTASALAFSDLKKIYRIPLYDVVTPAVERALKATKNGRVGVIGTRSTISSGAYRDALRLRNGKVRVYQQACPLFVPLVEEGWVENEVTRMVASEYLSPLVAQRIDTLILGCTHYPFLIPVLKQFLGPSVQVIDSASSVAEEVASSLTSHGMKAKRRRGRVKYLVTDDPERFAEFARERVGEVVEEIERVSL
ncbi:MAG: glutamate racemase [Deltaproteobacteria bacterium]|nr:MAG: glutamate racemase [Deltaproteobacteria bacterium]